MALSKLKLQQLREVCHEKDIDNSGLRKKKDLIERINEVCEARQAAIEDDEGDDEAGFDEDVASVDWLVLLANRFLKMAALIVVDRSPQTFSGCDYN